MIREDIIGGLKSALTRGYSLKDAMVSFYNAGYKKEEIEEAARRLQHQIFENKELRDLLGQVGGTAAVPEKPALNERVLPSHEIKPAEPNRPAQKAPAPVPRGLSVSPYHKTKKREEDATQFNLHKHNVAGRKEIKGLPGAGFRRSSEYEPSTGIRVVTIVLIVLLLLLLGILGVVFLFKNQIIQFFNNLIS